MILAVDQGTTGSTVLAFNEQGDVCRRAYSEFPQIYPKPGWVEHDPNVIWETTLKVIREAVTPEDTIAAIGITNQRETTVIWDRKTGEPIHNAIVWQCRRTAPRCTEMAEHKALIQARTGLVLDAYFSGTKIQWLLDNVAGARDRAQRGDLCFGTIDSWLIWKLTDGETHATDYTNASRTMLMDIYKRTWDEDLLKLMKVPKSMLPQVVPSSGFIGTAKVAPLQGVPIAGIAGDQQASLYGQHCHQPGLVKNTYGTGCFIMKYMGDHQVKADKGLLTTLACDEAGNPAYALEGSVFTAGAAIQWLRDGLGIINAAPETEALATSIQDNGGVYFVPAFVGLGAPYWDSNARGTIVGLTAGAGRAHLVRATLEALAYQTRDVLTAMCEVSGIAVKEMRVDGGASHNNFLMQFQADQLGIDVLRGSEAEKTAYGAALLAGKAVSFWSQAPQQRAESRRFSPQMSQEERGRYYELWKKAVRQARTE